jgi:ribosome-associated translation inhibitor RaiA
MNDAKAQTPVQPSEHLITTQISVSGDVSDAEQQRCVEAVSAALADIGEEVRRCTVRLEHGTDPHHVRRAEARLSVDLDGTPVFAHAEAETVDAAADLAATRLHERLRKQIDRRQDSRRHGDGLSEADWSAMDDDRVRSVPRSIPLDQRRIEARASFGPPDSTVDEAIFDLEALGYRFHLFVELQSGDDVIVRRHEERRDAYVLRFVHGEGTGQSARMCAADVEIDVRPAPHIPLIEAVDLLDIAGHDDVFFLDTETERGSVVYRRLDGHLGLTTPSA